MTNTNNYKLILSPDIVSQKIIKFLHLLITEQAFEIILFPITLMILPFIRFLIQLNHSQQQTLVGVIDEI